MIIKYTPFIQNVKLPDIIKELGISWQVLSSILLICLLAIVILNENTILNLSASCKIASEKPFSCILCGSTRAFLALKKGEFSYAMQLNKYCIPLCLLLATNSIFFITYTLKKSSTCKQQV